MSVCLVDRTANCSDIESDIATSRLEEHDLSICDRGRRIESGAHNTLVGTIVSKLRDSLEEIDSAVDEVCEMFAGVEVMTAGLRDHVKRPEVSSARWDLKIRIRHGSSARLNSN